jgi:uncharacterized protein YxjI
MSAIPQFFAHDEFFIDEKVAFLKFANEYKVFDKDAKQIGSIKEILTTGEKVLRLLINKSLLPFTFEIQDEEGKVLTIIRRGWTFWMSKIEVVSAEGQVLGYIQQKFQFFKPKFEILNANSEVVATIKGDFLAWNFSIVDNNEKQIGEISKKWAGLAKELFTSADKYRVVVDESLKEDVNKIIILSAAVTIDMVFKENKN